MAHPSNCRQKKEGRHKLGYGTFRALGLRNDRQNSRRAHGAFGVGLGEAVANSGISASSSTPSASGAAWGSRLTGGSQVFTQPGRTADVLAISTTLPPTFLESQSTTVPGITLPALGKPPNSGAGKDGPYGWGSLAE